MYVCMNIFISWGEGSLNHSVFLLSMSQILDYNDVKALTVSC